MTEYSIPDITNCEKEQIHIIGYIQPHGYLLGIDIENSEVIYFSGNIKNLLDIDNSTSYRIFDILPEEVSDIIKIGIRNNDFSNLNGTKISLSEKDFQIIINKRKKILIVEFEPLREVVPENQTHLIMGKALAKIQTSDNFQDLLNQTASEIKNITGYDRVMIYKFKPNWDGRVVAESKRDDLETMMDLHFPASDIPAQARELFKLNQIRIIVDVDAEDEKINSVNNVDTPLDLTCSTLRSSSPIHLQYLRNMGVKASMTISIIHKGILWGMITCHHYSPKYVNYPFRNTCNFIGNLFSSAIEFKYDVFAKEQLAGYYQKVSYLIKNVINGWDILEGLTNFETKITDINESDGAVICFEDQYYSIGNVPSQDQVSAIAERIREINNDSLFITHHLPKIHPDAVEYSSIASGVMMVGLSYRMKDFIMWFKPEQIETINWGGNPDKSINYDPDTQTLNPRKSFEKFTILSKHTSLEWSDSEIASAIKLREDLNNILINKTNEIRSLNDELKKAYEHLDTFSYTVSHDLKTPLASIRGYAEILLKYHSTKIDDSMAKFLNQIINNTDKMKGLIQDVLSYSKVGRIETQLELINPEPIINELIENIKISNQSKVIKFIVGKLPHIRGEKTMIYQIFNNLLTNAVKYGRENEPVTIKIIGTTDEKEITYSIEDNGTGFDMKNADRIFELFKRLEDVKQIEGTGLGLAIVKRIINLHKGKIWVKSAQGIGTTFYFSIPNG